MVTLVYSALQCEIRMLPLNPKLLGPEKVLKLINDCQEDYKPAQVAIEMGTIVPRFLEVKVMLQGHPSLVVAQGNCTNEWSL